MPKLTRERAASQRDRIITAATRCFAERGFHNSTMQDLFRRSGLTAGAVYGYFSSKHEIITTVVDARHRAERALLESTADAQDPLEHFLNSYFHQFLAPQADSQRRVTVQYWAESLHDQQLAALAHEGLGAREYAESLIAVAQRAGTVRADIDAANLSRMILALLQGLVLQLCWERDLDEAGVHSYRDAVLTLLRRPDRPSTLRVSDV
jgi:AcrR family transcriptional regulator